ncbi:MAG: PIN/TRAM domain-containing protein [Candidatus Velthaea sp.]
MSAARSSPGHSPGARAAAALLRVVFAGIFGTTGFLLGREAYLHAISIHVASQLWQFVLLILAPVAGAIVGVLLVPAAQSLFETELSAVERAIDRLAPGELVGGAIGLTTGLIIAFLAKSVLFEFITFAGRTGGYIAIVLYIVISIFAAFLGARVGAKQRVALGRMAGAPVASVPSGGVPKIIDTSVIIDGRILQIVESGFLEGPLVLPRFVLRELQLIADSGDSLKRSRGRRGLDVLTKLQSAATLEIVERDFDDVAQVDAKLVRLAQERGGKLVTNDFNLNRVAHVEGVDVLNINELANAVKPVLLPGEELRVLVIKEGKEPHQGIGYLEDGTMIVVENGRRLIGETVDVSVTSSLQTMAGRMIFARTKRA